MQLIICPYWDADDGENHHQAGFCPMSKASDRIRNSDHPVRRAAPYA
jgi:hypothetical protein